MFTKGIAKIGGRKKGTPNKLTGTFREAVLLAYENIGGHEAFSKWAADNQTEFYRIAARLIPTEIKSSETDSIRVIVYRPSAEIDRVDHADAVALSARNQAADATKFVAPALMGPALQK